MVLYIFLMLSSFGSWYKVSQFGNIFRLLFQIYLYFYNQWNSSVTCLQWFITFFLLFNFVTHFNRSVLLFLCCECYHFVSYSLCPFKVIQVIYFLPHLKKKKMLTILWETCGCLWMHEMYFSLRENLSLPNVNYWMNFKVNP